MAAATGVTRLKEPGVVITGSCTIDPGSIAAAESEEQTIAVAEARVGDVVVVSPAATLTDGLVLYGAHVKAAGTISFEIENNHTGAIDQGSTVFYWALLRGATGIKV